jgi:hypothetical protein
MPRIVIQCSLDERRWVEHAASLRGLSLFQYVKEAINASLRREGVDAVLLRVASDYRIGWGTGGPTR